MAAAAATEPARKPHSTRARSPLMVAVVTTNATMPTAQPSATRAGDDRAIRGWAAVSASM